MDFRVWGRENIPPGPKIYAVNHISSTDVYWILPVFPEPVHLVLGPCYKFRPLAWMLDRMEMVSAMPGDTRVVIESSVRLLQRGESIVIAPEGDLQEPYQLGPFQPGIAAIYRRTGAPIVPMALVAPRRSLREYPFPIVIEGRVYRTVAALRGPFCINVGAPLRPAVENGSRKDQNQLILAALRERMQALLDGVRSNEFWRN